MDIQTIRQDTPLLQDTIYLDTAAASIPPDSVLNEVCQYINDTGHVGIYQPKFRRVTYARVERVREDVASFLGAQPDEIAFTKNGSESISLIARGIDWQAGDEVLVADTEMLSNLLPWRRLEQTHNIVVKMIKADSQGLLSADSFASAISPQSRLITFSHIPNSTGAVQPVDAICALAREHGVLTLVNASQSVGMLPTNVGKIECDFLACCGRKALRATEGTGILYIRSTLTSDLEPMLTGWWNGSYDRETNEVSLVTGARRFEAGCPIVPAIVGLGAAVAYAKEIGIETIADRVAELTSYAIDRLTNLTGFELYGPEDVKNRQGIIPFNLKDLDPALIAETLEARQCIIEAGSFMANSILSRYGVENMARISLHYFNTFKEIDTLAELIQSVPGYKS